MISEEILFRYKMPSKCCSCDPCAKNEKTARRLIDLLLSFNDIPALINILDDSTFTIQDQSGIIPYAGTFVGASNLAVFIGLYGSYVSVSSFSRDDAFYAGGDCDDIIIPVTVTQQNRLTPGGDLSSPVYTFDMYFRFTFKHHHLISTTITFDTSALVIFYSSLSS